MPHLKHNSDSYDDYKWMTECKSSSNDILLRNYYCKWNETMKTNSNKGNKLNINTYSICFGICLIFHRILTILNVNFQFYKSFVWYLVHCLLEQDCFVYFRKFLWTNFTPFEPQSYEWQIVAHTRLPLAIFFLLK